MKKLVLLVACATVLTSCTSKWEYKTVTVEGEESIMMEDFMTKSFDMPDSTLNAIGAEGWELVDVYTLTETVHPNFGRSEYVTGLQPNVRSSKLGFVFKRKK